MVLDAIWKKYDLTSPERDSDYWLLNFGFEVLIKFLNSEKVIELGCSRGF